MTFKTTNLLQESSDKSVIELQQYAKKNKPNLHILNKLQEEMRKLAKQRVRKVPVARNENGNHIILFPPRNAFRHHQLNYLHWCFSHGDVSKCLLGLY